MRAERLLRIVMVLQSKERVTAAELAREFEISARTILRDMEVLSGMGIPVCVSYLMGSTQIQPQGFET